MYNRRRYQTDKESLDAFMAWSKVLGVNRLEKEEKQDMVDRIHATVVGNASDTRYGSNVQMEDDFDPFLPEPTYNVDRETGEVLPEPIAEQDEITLYREAQTPEYLLQLSHPTNQNSAIANMSEADKAALLSIYESARTARSFKEFLNMEVDIYGAIIWYHPPFKANIKDENGNPLNLPEQPGYHQVLLLTMEEEKPILIKAAYGALAVHISAILDLRGWFIWDEPVKYKFTQDLKTNAFQMINQDRVKSILSSMKKGGKK